MVRSLILFICVGVCGQLSAQYSYDFNEKCIEAYNEIIAFRFDNGRSLIETEKNQHGDNLIPYLLEHHIIFLTLVTNEKEGHFKQLKEAHEDIYDRLKDGDEDSPYYNFALAQVHLQWAVVRAKFREYIAALQNINRAYRLLEENQEKFPEFKPNLINLGVLHTLFGTIPDNFGWIKSIVGLEGTVDQGINELFIAFDATLNDSTYSHLKAECLFLLSFIQLNLQSDKSLALEYAGYFYEYYDVENNMMVLYALARIYMNNGMNDKAIEVLLQKPKSIEYYPFDYLDYLTGLAKLYRLDNDALIFLLQYVINFEGINYIKSAYQKIAWYYLIEGDTVKYYEYMNKVLQYGNTMVDSDKQAEREAEKSLIPNVVLLRARLLFDGGYYQKAEGELLGDKKTIFLVTDRDTLEYNYRLGRIYHEWDKSSDAIRYYKLTISMGSESEYYYAANAALKLGIIYENAKDYQSAHYYFTAAQNMENKEYRNSINQKAKAGLSRIRDKE